MDTLIALTYLLTLLVSVMWSVKSAFDVACCESPDDSRRPAGIILWFVFLCLLSRLQKTIATIVLKVSE